MRELMQPLHAVVPKKVREKIEREALDAHISIGEVTRDLIQAGIESKGWRI